jgi:hypothetical protein
LTRINYQNSFHFIYKMDKNSSIVVLFLIFLCIMSIGIAQYNLAGTLKTVLTLIAFGILVIALVLALTDTLKSPTPRPPKEDQYKCTNGKCTAVSTGGTSLADCQANCPKKPGEDQYKCTNGKCTAVSTGGTSLTDCQANCPKKPGEDQYKCTNGKCTTVSTGGTSLADCQASCKSPGATQFSVSSTEMSKVVNQNNVFNPVSIMKMLFQKSIPTTAALMNYVSMEYDPFNFPPNALNGSQQIEKGILYWFTNTLKQCQSGDTVIINGDFISMDGTTKDLLQTKCQAGVNVILVVDRWEISGYPLLSSQTNQDWSPNQDQYDGCISSGACKSSSNFNQYPYGCPDQSPGAGNTYCPDTNQIIIQLQSCSSFYLLDQAVTKLNMGTGGTSRNSPLHNHRHITSFYMPSQGLGSVFKGSWNFTGGSPDETNSLPGQKESGFTVTASLDSDVLQNDIIWNYYWLTAMSVFSPTSLSPPSSFTQPGPTASPIFGKLLKLIHPGSHDTTNDQLVFNPYGSQTELYSITTTNNTIYVSADLAVLSIGFAPPPGPLRNAKGLANPTPWEGTTSNMLKRTISDSGMQKPFKDIWGDLSCVSNTLEFMYPYTPVYNKNPMIAPSWRVLDQSSAPNCSNSSLEPFEAANIGQPCASDSDCPTNAKCLNKFCVFKDDKVCTNCDSCGLAKNRPKSQVCAVNGHWPPAQGDAPGCYSVTKSNCTPDSSGNIKCTPECPCFTCVPPPPPPRSCPPATESNDLGSLCFTKDATGNIIPSNGCFSLDGKNYSCAARVPWAPGGLWLGGLMYKFWNEADSKDNIYVSMYSSFDDAGTGCILNCGQGNTGGASAWGEGLLTSSQYNSPNTSMIDSGYWYSQADSNSVQNVLDFLGNGGSVYLLRGQWSALSPGTDGAFTAFKQAAQGKGGSYNVKLYLAQTTQVTSTGSGNTTTTHVGSDKNPDKSTVSQRNHTKCYISSNSIASCSGHPYNGGVQDWGGINEVLLVEKCPNACKPIRNNWEQEWKYGEQLQNAATFPWAKDWSGQVDVNNLKPTSLSPTTWATGSTNGGIISL